MSSGLLAARLLSEATLRDVAAMDTDGDGNVSTEEVLHRGSRRPSLANRTHGQCGCNQSFPAVDTYVTQLTEWARHNPSPLNRKLLSSARGGLTALIQPRSITTAGAAHRACLSMHCAAKRLMGRWILFMGDSTQRKLHDAFLDLLAAQFGMEELTVQPHLDGLPVKDRDQHKDYDTVCLHPRGGYRPGALQAKAERHREPECFGPLHPECHAQRPNLHWWANASGAPSTRVSMRFLRGLDTHKLEHNSKAWRERFHYKEWRQRSMNAPPNLLFGSAPFTDHPVTRAFWGRTPEPDAIIFNSCAWDLPQINRSNYYFPYMVPGYPCAQPPPTVNVTVRIREQRVAPVIGCPCVKRGIKLSDEQIIEDYGQRLRVALILIRKRFRGRLILRSCHSGTQDRRETEHAQFEALRLMNAKLLSVARELCVEVLDVFELDRLAGYYNEKKVANFHVPPEASAQAAMAAMLLLRLGVGARGDHDKCGARGKP